LSDIWINGRSLSGIWINGCATLKAGLFCFIFTMGVWEGEKRKTTKTQKKKEAETTFYPNNFVFFVVLKINHCHS
jgi:hypothetical protein